MVMAIIFSWVVLLAALIYTIGKAFECLSSLLAPSNTFEDHQESHP
jgi:hypothetical protein